MRKNRELITHGYFLKITSANKDCCGSDLCQAQITAPCLWGHDGLEGKQEEVEAYLRSSPILVVRLTIKVEAPVWGRAKAAPKPKARTLRPAPTERPDMKSRL